MSMTGAVCIYVQHLMGIGHQRRMAAICRALRRRGVAVTYVSGGEPVPGLDTADAAFVQLPPCRCPDLHYDRLVRPDGTPVDDRWRALRRTRLMDAWRSRSHAVLLVETYPFGRKLLRFELAPLLERARVDGAKCVSSIRDIIDYRPKHSKYVVMAEAALQSFDAVLVHSDRNWIALEDSFPATGRIAHLLHYTGFVDEGADVVSTAESGAAPAGLDEVLVSAGGGAYGEHVLRAALEARPQSVFRSHRWRLLVGPNLPHERFADLQRSAGGEVIVERARTDFRMMLRRAALSVSQGGYNTVIDLLVTGVASVVVAYHDQTEREQLLRARALQARGLLTVLPDVELEPASLATAMERAQSDARRRSRTAFGSVRVDGAERSAELLAAWAGQVG
ncbi:MAG: glycosyltransferase [Pseudomonadota bacterium]